MSLRTPYDPRWYDCIFLQTEAEASRPAFTAA